MCAVCARADVAESAARAPAGGGRKCGGGAGPGERARAYRRRHVRPARGGQFRARHDGEDVRAGARRAGGRAAPNPRDCAAFQVRLR